MRPLREHRGTLGVLGALMVISSLLIANPPATAVSPRADAATDIVLLVDSTGQSAADWAVLQGTYLRALANEDFFPRDGSVAVSLVQYAEVGQSAQASQVTVPLTILNRTGYTTLTKAIKAAPLYSPRSAGKSAVESALAELEARGTSGASRNICATATAAWPDGLITASARLLDAAQVERMSLLTMATSRWKPTNATQQFAALARGDGVALGTRSIPQGSSVVPTICLSPRVIVRAIEVNQVIQNWHNDVPLVEYKDTIVRVFVESALWPIGTTSGVLHGTRDGVSLSGSPLSPINKTGEIGIDSDVQNEADRGDFDSSLNFKLPTSWLSGDVELRFESTSAGTCASIIGADCAVDVSFIEAAEPAITYVSVPYSSGSTDFEPTTAELVEQLYRTMDTFPIRYVDMGFEFLPSVGTSEPDLGDVNDTLFAYWVFEAIAEDPSLWWTSEDRWYGLLDGSGGGLADGVPGLVSSGFLSGTGATEAYGYGRNRGPHELAHTFGAHHITNDAVNGVKTYSNGAVASKGWCGEVSSTSAPDYPYWSSLGGTDYPTLGPLGTPEDEIWGLAPRFEGDNENLLVINPYDVFPLMSYCGALDTSSQYRWPSLQTYEVLTEEFLGTDIDLSAKADSPPRPGILVRGTVSIDGGLNNVAPNLPVPTAAYSQAPGDWEVRALDDNRKVLATRQFTPEIPLEGDPDQPPADPAEPGEPDVTAAIAPFAVVFPASLQRSMATIEIYKKMDGASPQLMGSVTKSAKSPTVTIDAVRPTGAGTTITWVARDADSVELYSSVFYRATAKEPWKLVAADVPGDSATIPNGSLPGSATGQFSVVTSDGINFARATSKPARTLDQAPELTIIGPSDIVLGGGQNATLRAFAFDVEDGDISDSIVWRLGRNALVGDAESFPILADSLPAGTHLVSITVTDSSGKKRSAQAKVRVTRVMPAADR